MNFDAKKAIEAVALVLMNIQEHSCDFHKVFKILYFADQKHLASLGVLIFNDSYIAMKNGPVPSNLYDMIKTLKNNSFIQLKTELNLASFFKIEDNYNLKLLSPSVNLSLFSEFEIDCITQSIEENKLLDFNTLTKKSHDEAWNLTESNNMMSIFQISKAGGANDEMIKYMSLQLENETLWA